MDSTRYRATFACPRKRFYLTEYGGRGIVLAAPSEDLLYGSAVHKGCELLAGGMIFQEAFMYAQRELLPLSPSLTPEGHDHRLELEALLYGHLRLYQDYILPALLEEYDIFAIEQEIVIPLTESVTYLTRIDKGLRRKSNGTNFNLNYKTSSYIDDLQSSVECSMQLLMEAEALKYATGSFVTGSLVIGFNKGSKRSVSEAEKKRGLEGKRRISPFTYGYMKGDDPWDPKTQYSAEYKAGWTRFPTFVEPWTHEDWWNRMPDALRRGQYMTTTPIIHQPEMIARLKEQIVHVEQRLAEYRDTDDLDALYPQNFANCNQDEGYMHSTCPYKPFCWEGEDPDMLIGGAFKWREINHPYEEAFVPQEGAA